jgi:c-di-GMP-related signal transduction protein
VDEVRHGQAGRDVRPVHVGRQPIYTIDGDLYAYELLFRGGPDATEATSRGVYATSQVLINACAEFGLYQLTGGRPAFVNLTREFLVGELPLPFEPDQAVLEVLETVPVDDEVIAGVTRLAGQGYAIALDDFVPGTPAHALLDVAGYVKIDALGVGAGELAAVVAAVRPRPEQRLLAERVETRDGLKVVRDLGFSLVQGYVFARPEVVQGQRLLISGLPTLRLLSALSDPAVSIRELTALVSADPALCYRLLTMANSAAVATSRPISSIRDAVVLVGTARLRQWLTLMAVADLAGTEDRAATVLIQARFCHEIAARAGLAAESAFTIGLLDAVCELTDESRVAVTEQLSLAADLSGALVGGAGPLARVLSTARAYQRREDGPPLGQRTPDLVGAYLAAVSWAHSIGV